MGDQAVRVAGGATGSSPRSHLAPLGMALQQGTRARWAGTAPTLPRASRPGWHTKVL